MAEFFTGKNEAITHPSIVHELLKKIVVELSTREFKGGYEKPVINGGITYMDYVTDSRAEYIQAIESLATILLPQYDEIMTKAYDAYEESVKELEAGIEEKDIWMGDTEHSRLIRNKMKLVKILFKELNLLLKRTNYLKVAPHSESEDDEEEW